MKNMPYGSMIAIWIWCTICSQPMFGYLMFISAPFAVLWWIIQAIRVLRQPENWRRHKIIGAAWLIGLAACFAINAHYVYAAEQDMRQVVADIERYRAQDMLHASYGKTERTGEFDLIYKVPYIIHDYYRYDFQTQQWEHRG